MHEQVPSKECFWKMCSDRKRCEAFGSCVALAQAGGATFPQAMPGDTSPVSHLEILSAVSHHAREIARLTAAVPVACSGHEPPVRQCNHGAISPKGTLFYHGFVGAANHWRCDVCKGVYEGNLTAPTKQGSQLLTLVSSPKPPPPEAHWLWVASLALQITAPAMHEDETEWRVEGYSGRSHSYRGATLVEALRDFWDSEIRSRDLDGNPTEPDRPLPPTPTKSAESPCDRSGG